MDQLLQDLRYTGRVLRKSPAFSLVAILTIALGIGVNSAIFSIVNAVLLRSLPVSEPGRLVNVYGGTTNSTEHSTMSFPDFEDYRAQSTTLTGAVAHTNFFANLSVEGSSELVIGEIVSDQFFQLLGVQPVLGRAFTSEEFAAPGAGTSVILSHAFWATRFASDPQVVGRTLRLNGKVYQVAGVAPDGFRRHVPRRDRSDVASVVDDRRCRGARESARHDLRGQLTPRTTAEPVPVGKGTDGARNSDRAGRSGDAGDQRPTEQPVP